MAWPIVTFNGQQYRQREGVMLLPLESSGAAIIMVKDDGGAIANGVTSVEQGPSGQPANIDEAINFSPLEPGDPTADFAYWSTLVPPTVGAPGLWRLNLGLHKIKGEDGKTVWDPTDLAETPIAGQIPVVNSAANGFELQAQKITEVFYPGAINNTASGNPNSKLCEINIPARPFARRIRAGGYTVVTGEADDVRVDLVARLNGESGGNIVGRCQGIARTERLPMDPGKPIEEATSSGTYDVLAANTASIVYVRCERKAGTSTYTTTAATSKFWTEAIPLP